MPQQSGKGGSRSKPPPSHNKPTGKAAIKAKKQKRQKRKMQKVGSQGS